ncbi:PEP-CTERM sorting domain-containing protein [bacterium]|nr:MAG: PEP-CTERM sorting domain-containing protein [bacterium]
MKRSILLLSLLAVGATASAQSYLHDFEENYVDNRTQWVEQIDWETGETTWVEEEVSERVFVNPTAGGFTYSLANGEQFDQYHAMDRAAWQRESNTSSFTSGDWALKGSSDNALNVVRDENFNFDGGFFSSYTAGDAYAIWSSVSVTFEGYRDGALVDSFDMDLTAGLFVGTTGRLTNIDELRIFGTGTNSYWPLGELIMDDLSFSEVTTQAVPEPTSMAALGLGGLALLRRRRKSA